MANLSGSSTEVIDAPIEQVWAAIEPVEEAPQWQGGVKSMVAVEHDGEGRAVLCDTENDAKVRAVKSRVRFTYAGPTTLSWVQEKGDLKAVAGRWTLEDLGGRTRATYEIEVDLGRVLGLAIRGPLVDLLRGELAGARAAELKARVESRA